MRSYGTKPTNKLQAQPLIAALSILSKMKIQRCLVHCCYAVVGLVLLASTPTSAEKEDQIQNSVGMSISGGGVVAGLHGAAIMRGIQQQKVEIDGKMRPAMEAFDYLAGLSG